MVNTRIRLKTGVGIGFQEFAERMIGYSCLPPVRCTSIEKPNLNPICRKDVPGKDRIFSSWLPNLLDAPPSLVRCRLMKLFPLQRINQMLKIFFEKCVYRAQ